MNVEKEIVILIKEIENGMMVFKRILDFYKEYLNKIDVTSKKTEDAIVISDVFVNAYTCLETIFLRISRFFENNLDEQCWHQDLLYKMTLSIEGIREKVISDETHTILLEFLRFRHFKRYYFEFNYDWDKINFLQNKFELLIPLIQEDISKFINFLRRLAKK